MDKEKYEQLLEAADRYYNGGEYLMDDKSYDLLLSTAKRELPGFDIFKAIGYIGTGGADDTPHSIVFPPFGKEYMKVDMTPAQFVYYGEYKDYFAEKVKLGAKWFYKYDGCSLILYYDPATGILDDIVTRSNEEVGKNRFKNFVRLVPKQIPKGIRAILCEVMVPLKFGFDFTSRNKANGLTSSKYKVAEINEMCVVVGCDIVIGDVAKEIAENTWHLDKAYNFTTYSERYELFKSIPNKSVDGRITFYTANPVDVSKMTGYKIREVVSDGNVSETLDFRVDGIVLYMNDYTEAYKAYYVDSAEAPVEDISWPISEKEQWIPNIEIEPTVLEGTPITNIATNGVATLLDKNIAKGTIIQVAKVGMASPQVIKVISNPRKPDLPVCQCGHQFTEDDILIQGLFCPNEDCCMKLENRRAWFKDYDHQSTLNGIWTKPVDFLIKPINIPNFRTERVSWKDEDIQNILVCINSIDVDNFIKIIRKYYDFNELKMRSVRANTKALLVVLNECLNK